MGNDQVKLLTNLAKKIKSRPQNKARIIFTLTSAKIITKNGNLTDHYSNLSKAISFSK
jgi:hypothetical protein